MSNRIRILFHSPWDGVRAHTGKHALAAMQRLVQTFAEKERWVTAKEWWALGKPEYTVRQLDPNPFGSPSMMYLIAAPGAAHKPITAKSLLARAKILWARLPSVAKQSSRLIVCRESRQHDWSRSLANPAKYGWIKAVDKTGGAAESAPETPSISSTPNAGFTGVPSTSQTVPTPTGYTTYVGWWADGVGIQNAAGHLANEPVLPEPTLPTPTLPPGSIAELANQLLEADASAQKKAMLKEMENAILYGKPAYGIKYPKVKKKVKPNLKVGAGAGVGAATYGNPPTYKKVKSAYIDDNGKYVPSELEEVHAETGEPILTPKIPKSTPAAPAKPKLRLGIWA